MSGSVSIASGNEDDLLAAVATVGPISAVVDAASNAFRVRVIPRQKIVAYTRMLLGIYMYIYECGCALKCIISCLISKTTFKHLYFKCKFW